MRKRNIWTIGAAGICLAVGLGAAGMAQAQMPEDRGGPNAGGPAASEPGGTAGGAPGAAMKMGEGPAGVPKAPTPGNPSVQSSSHKMTGDERHTGGGGKAAMGSEDMPKGKNGKADRQAGREDATSKTGDRGGKDWKGDKAADRNSDRDRGNRHADDSDKQGARHADDDHGKGGSDRHADRDQRGGGKHAEWNESHKKEVRNYFHGHQPHHGHRYDRNDFNITIGFAVPSRVTLYDLPAAIVVGGPCPIDYFVWGDDVVLVDSCSREVIDIIPNAA